MLINAVRRRVDHVVVRPRVRIGVDRGEHGRARPGCGGRRLVVVSVVLIASLAFSEVRDRSGGCGSGGCSSGGCHSTGLLRRAQRGRGRWCPRHRRFRRTSRPSRSPPARVRARAARRRRPPTGTRSPCRWRCASSSAPPPRGRARRTAGDRDLRGAQDAVERPAEEPVDPDGARATCAPASSGSGPSAAARTERDRGWSGGGWSTVITQSTAAARLDDRIEHRRRVVTQPPPRLVPAEHDERGAPSGESAASYGHGYGVVPATSPESGRGRAGSVIVFGVAHAKAPDQFGEGRRGPRSGEGGRCQGSRRRRPCRSSAARSAAS